MLEVINGIRCVRIARTENRISKMFTKKTKHPVDCPRP